jgi:hypothetical protein
LAPVAANGGVPAYEEFQIQARSNFNQTIGTYNLPASAFFSGPTIQLNDVLDVSFHLTVNPGGDSDSLWFGRNGGGQIVLLGPDGAFWSNPTLNNNGFIVWEQSLSAQNGLFFYDSATAASGILTNRPLGASGWGSPVVNDAGVVGFRASFLGSNAYVSFAGELNPPFHAADVAVDSMSPYSFLFTSSFNNQRQIAGKVRLGGPGQTGNSQPDQIRVFAQGGSSVLIAEDQDGNPRSVYASFDNGVFLTDDGWVAFTAGMVGGGRCVRISNGTATTNIACESDPEISSIEFFAPAANNSHLVAFRAFNASGLRAIWVGDGATLAPVVTEHDLIGIDQGLTARIDQETTSNPVFGGGVSINECGDVAFNAGVAPPDNDQIEWGSGVFVAYAERIADGDYDCNGVHDERDALYFVDCLGGPADDVNTTLSPAYICTGKFDFDTNGAVDLADYAELQRRY